jgi:ABC-type Fe2+-enterobactin transport system substrate-binding protein
MAGHVVVQLGREVGRQRDIAARLAVLEARLTAVNDQLTHPQPAPLEIEIAQFEPIDLAAPQARIVVTTTEIGECLA